MYEQFPRSPADRYVRALRRVSVGALLVAVGVQGLFVFTRATAILLDGVSEAVVKVLS